MKIIKIDLSIGFLDNVPKTLLCVSQAVSTYNVSGRGMLVGFIDCGIDYTHPAFMNEDGTTRIEYIYDLSNNDVVYNKQQSFLI